MILAYDFEVFRYNWMVVIADLVAEKEEVIIDDSAKLKSFYESHKDYLWVGFNSSAYDQWILKSILAGYNPYDMNEHLITKKMKGWQFSDSLRDYKLYNYDCYLENKGSLKRLEGYMGSSIHESSVDFRINRPLTEDEIKETVKYCRHDVSETIKVFCKRKSEFDALFSLIKLYNLPLEDITKTKAQCSATVLGAEKHEYDDEWNFPLEKECIEGIKKYTNVVDWFSSSESRVPNAELNVVVGGCPCTFAQGGVHGAIKNYFEKGRFLCADVASLYPSEMIQYNLLSRSAKNKDRYVEIYHKRLQLKAEGKKKEQAPYKIVLNATYGIQNFKYSPMYDPQRAHRVCFLGQLALLDLSEKVEHLGQISQVNTDGLYIKINETKGCEEEFYRICEDWEKRYRLNLEFDVVKALYQKDVNNYIEVYEKVDKNGNPIIKAKGAMVKDLSELDYDLPIVNFAIRAYFVYGVPPEKTVQDNNNLIDFQKIYHVSSLYDRALKNCTFSKESYIKEETGRKNTRTVWNNDGIVFETERTFRVFASKDQNEGALYKQKIGKNPEKFAGSPEHCFIENGNIVGKTCEEYIDVLDKQWYIDEAYRRIRQFKEGR